MDGIIFISGGARSGKSGFALKLAKERSDKVAFIATSEALDKEMKRRILIHKKSRPRGWKTFEEPLDLPILLDEIAGRFDFIIIDCLTLLLSNLLLKGVKQKEIEKIVRKICLIFKKSKAVAIIISNEVGMGIVPGNKLSRQFRDIAGRVNQIVAKEADQAFFMVSGVPLKLK